MREFCKLHKDWTFKIPWCHDTKHSWLLVFHHKPFTLWPHDDKIPQTRRENSKRKYSSIPCICFFSSGGKSTFPILLRFNRQFSMLQHHAILQDLHSTPQKKGSPWWQQPHNTARRAGWRICADIQATGDGSNLFEIVLHSTRIRVKLSKEDFNGWLTFSSGTRHGNLFTIY